MQIQNAAVTGSFTYNGVDISSITGSTSNITSLNAITASIFTTTASLNAASGSAITRLSALEVTSGSNITRISALESASGSAITRLSSIESTTGSLNSASGSAITRLSALEVTSGSNITRIAALEVTSGSNISRLSSLEAQTGSYATTGSNTFVGSQTITGSILGSGSLSINGCIVSTGAIVAQTINVQQVTSSIVYSCGSNIFGTALNNSQVFTGSMFVTGSNIVANVGATCLTGTAYIVGNTCIGGGIVVQNASTFCNTVGLFGVSPQLYIGGSSGASDFAILQWCATDKSLNIHNQSTGNNPQLIIACNGNVGVKTIAAPNYDLEVRGNIGVVSSTSAGLITTSTLCAAGTVTGLIRFDGLHTPSLTTYTGPSINACKDDANYATSLVFKTTDGSGGNNVNLRITGAGVSCFAGIACVPTLYANNCINIGTTTSLGSRLSIESCNDQAGITMYNSYDCNKWSLRTGTTGINNKGFGIVDDICNATRIQIDGAGNVGIGILNPGRTLHVLGQTGIGTVLKLEGAPGTTTYLQLSYNGATNVQSGYIGYDSSANMPFFTNDTERMRITSDGYVGITGNQGLKCVPYLQGMSFGWNRSNGQGESMINWTNAGGGTACDLVFNFRDSTTLYERLRLTSLGNLGLGVTPSAWTGTNVKAFQFGNSGALANSGTFGTIVFNNSYYDGGYKYITSNSASAYVQDGSTHLWYQAPSGTAGNAISFTQAMTLNACGRLILGNTTDNTYSRLQVAGGAWIGQNAGRGLYFADGASYTSVVGLNQAVNTYNAVELRASGVDGQLFLATSGNVGIGQTNPSFALEVFSSAQTAVTSNNTFGANFNIIFNRDNTGGTRNCFNILADQNAAYLRTLNNYPMVFVTNGTERMRIASTGNTSFGSNASTIIGGDGGAGFIYSYASGDPKIYIEANGVVAFLNPNGVGVKNTNPNGLFEVGMTCAKTTYGGFLVNTLSVADSNWFCFFCPPANWAGLMTMNWVAPNDFNRSGAAQVRWSYQNCSAALGPTTSIFNDSQNATATFRYAGGWLQACITGAGAGYNVQFTILGARGA